MTSQESAEDKTLSDSPLPAGHLAGHFLYSIYFHHHLFYGGGIVDLNSLSWSFPLKKCSCLNGTSLKVVMLIIQRTHSGFFSRVDLNPFSAWHPQTTSDQCQQVKYQLKRSVSLVSVFEKGDFSTKSDLKLFWPFRIMLCSLFSRIPSDAWGVIPLPPL